MPIVARIDGVKIYFYPDEHPPPHFHALFAEFVAQIRIDPPQVLHGSLPPAKLRTVLSWATRNRDGLMAAWMAVEGNAKPEKIQ